MNKDNSLRLLDCTLRDGGFINDWEFGHETIVNIFERAVSAGADIIEVGFIDERRLFDINRTIMPDGEAVDRIFSGIDHGNSMVVGMIDYGTCSVEKLKPCSDSIMDGIRVIFKKKNRREAISFCGELKKLGYQVFVQPVSITSYSDEEMIELVEMVNELKPMAMSIVDTYGLLHESGLLHYFEIIDAHLDKDISMGYHAHNNFQLGYSNCIAVIESNAAKPKDMRRDLVIDGSVFGMGKGAGNAPIELVAMYMNNHFGKSYDISQILETIDVSIMKIYLKTPWGYSLKYYLAASNDCHPNYVQHLMQKRTLSVRSINEILDQIAPQEKLAYNADHIEELYVAYQSREINDKEHIDVLKERFNGKKLLILGPGKTIGLQKEKIVSFVAKNKPIVISINYEPEDIYTDYIFVSNSKRYVTLEGRLYARQQTDENRPKVIATSNVTPARGSFDYQVDYGSLIDESFEIPDSSLIMLLKLLGRLDILDINLAGFDGYSSSRGENYFNVAMEYAFVKDKAEALNEYTVNSLRKLQQDFGMRFNFLTDTKYTL